MGILVVRPILTIINERQIKYDDYHERQMLGYFDPEPNEWGGHNPIKTEGRHHKTGEPLGIDYFDIPAAWQAVAPR